MKDFGVEEREHLEAWNFSFRLSLTLAYIGGYPRFVRCLNVREQLCVCGWDAASARQPRKAVWIDVSLFVHRCNSRVLCTSALRKGDWPNAIDRPEMLHTYSFLHSLAGCTAGFRSRPEAETGIPAVHPSSECRKVVLPCTTNGSDYCSCYCSCYCSSSCRCC